MERATECIRSITLLLQPCRRDLFICPASTEQMPCVTQCNKSAGALEWWVDLFPPWPYLSRAVGKDRGVLHVPYPEDLYLFTLE